MRLVSRTLAAPEAVRALVGSVALALLSAACVPGPGEEDAGPTSPWAMVFEGLPGALLSVAGTASDDVWIVGADKRDGTGPTILHYTGDGFDAHETGDEGDLWWVSIEPSSGDVWMVGDGGRIFRRDKDDGALDAMNAPDDTRLYGVMAFAPDDVWAVGGDEQANTGVIWHFDGAAWARPESATDEVTSGLIFFKVWGASADDFWIVGVGGAALHYESGTFTRVEPIARPLFTVHGAGDLVVGVGGFVGGLIVEAQGGALVDKTPANAPELIGVHVSDDGHAVAAGYEGAVWHRSTAGQWTMDDDAPITDFSLSYHAVYEDPAGGIWAAGGFLDAEPLQQGMLAHYGEEIRDDVR